MIRIVIPTRLDSRRFPGKALHKIGSKTLIQRCYETALKSKLANEIYLTTPDEAIMYEATNWMPVGNIISSSPTLRNGTERIAEAIIHRKWSLDDIIVNLQGDQFGETMGDFIDGPILLAQRRQNEICTTIRTVHGQMELDNPNVVKVIIEDPCHGEDILGMSVLGFYRNIPVGYSSCGRIAIHIGIYVATAAKFVEYYTSRQTAAERVQGLEQLRWKYPFRAYLTEDEIIAVDTPIAKSA